MGNDSNTVVATIKYFKNIEKRDSNYALVVIVGKVLPLDTAIVNQFRALHAYPEGTPLPVISFKVTKHLHGDKIGDSVVIYNSTLCWDPIYCAGSEWLFVLCENLHVDDETKPLLFVDENFESALKKVDSNFIGKFYNNTPGKNDTVSIKDVKNVLSTQLNK
jgi:hypothetical protein